MDPNLIFLSAKIFKNLLVSGFYLIFSIAPSQIPKLHIFIVFEYQPELIMCLMIVIFMKILRITLVLRGFCFYFFLYMNNYFLFDELDPNDVTDFFLDSTFWIEIRHSLPVKFVFNTIKSYYIFCPAKTTRNT